MVIESVEFQSVMKDLEGYLTSEQVEKILSNAKSKRDRTLILFGWRTGRRISELLEVRKFHIDFDKALVRFHILKKKKKDHYVLKPVDSELLEVLKVYTSEMQPNDFIFPSPYIKNKALSRKQAYNIIRSTAERAAVFFVGTKPMHPHVLRHSFSVHFLRHAKNKSVALRILQSILEHSTLGQTATYLQFSQEDLRKELENVFGNNGGN